MPKLYSPIKKNIIKNKEIISDSEYTAKSSVAKKTRGSIKTAITSAAICSICKKSITANDYIKADGGNTIICKKCFGKLF